MNNSNRLITRILFSVHKDHFNDDVLNIVIRVCNRLNNQFGFRDLIKTNTINNINIYESLCDIFCNSDTVIITLCNPPFNDMLKGNGTLHIIEDDINYNHVNDICGNIFHPKDYELSYSVNNLFFKSSAITLFVDPLKYPQLVSLVLFQFLNNNDYPQDLKNYILLLYNYV